MVQTYNELRVTFDREGKKIIDKNPTKRGTVRISEQTANVNNAHVNSTKLLYELAEVDEPTELRLSLEKKAKELEITFRSNIGDDNLLLKIKEIEPNFEL